MNPRKKIYISLIFFVAAIIVLIIFILVPLFTSIKKNSDNLLSQKENLALLQKEIETFNETKSLYEDSKANIDRVDKLFYDSDNPLDFLNFLTKNPESYNVRNEIIKMAPNVNILSDPWPSISFQLLGTGSFPNLMRFLKNLEAGPYLIEISNISIKRLTEDELRGEKLKSFSLGDVSATLSIKVYSK